MPDNISLASLDCLRQNSEALYRVVKDYQPIEESNKSKLLYKIIKLFIDDKPLQYNSNINRFDHVGLKKSFNFIVKTAIGYVVDIPLSATPLAFGSAVTNAPAIYSTQKHINRLHELLYVNFDRVFAEDSRAIERLNANEMISFVTKQKTKKRDALYKSSIPLKRFSIVMAIIGSLKSGIKRINGTLGVQRDSAATILYNAAKGELEGIEYIRYCWRARALVAELLGSYLCFESWMEMFNLLNLQSKKQAIEFIKTKLAPK